MQSSISKFHQILAGYYNGKPLYLDEPINKQANIRKSMEQPWQQTKTAILEKSKDFWDLIIGTLCNLRFIEAKCRAKMTFALIDDYNFALNNLPENLAEIKQEQQQSESIDRWTREIIEYCKKWNERGNRSVTDPHFPEFPFSFPIWTQEEIDAEYKRIAENPTRLDKLRAFFEFVSKEFQSLNELNEYPGFTIQHAFNCGSGRIISKSAELFLSEEKSPKLLRECYEKNVFGSNPSLLKTLEGRNSRINCVDMTPNGRFIVTGCEDSSIRVWDSMYGKCIKEIHPGGFPVTKISITPDGRLAITSTTDGRSNAFLQLWDLETGNCRQILKGHTSRISSVSMTPDGTTAVSSSPDKTIRVWDLNNGTILHVLNDEANCVCITLDGKKAVSASGPFIKIWDIIHGKLIKSIEGGERNYFGSRCTVIFDKIKITPDGKTAVTSNEGFPRCMVWNLETEVCLKEVGINGGGEISITPDAKYAMFTGSGPTSRNPFVMDLISGEVVRIFEGHTERVTDVCISPRNKFGISVSNDNTIKKWNIEKGKISSDKKVKALSPIRKILISNDHSKIFSQTDRDICAWDLNTGQYLKHLKIASNGNKRSIDNFYITSDNKYFITTFKYAENNICIWDCNGDVLLHELKGHTAEIDLIRISPDNNLIISASQKDCSIRAWDINSGICLWTMEAVNLIPEFFNISTDGKYVIYFSGNNILNVINTKNGESIGHYEVEYHYKASYDYGVIMNEDHTGDQLSLLRINSAYIIRNLSNSACFCTLGSVKLTSDCKFAIDSDVHLLTMWDLTTGNCIKRFDNENKRKVINGIFLNPNFYDYVITPDDQYIISTNNDHTVRIWQIESGKCIAAEHINSPRSSLAFSMSKKKILIGTWLEELQIYNLTGVNFKPD